jgi:hypothetical protein
MSVVVNFPKGHYNVTFSMTDVSPAGLVSAPGVKAGDVVQTMIIYNNDGTLYGGASEGPFAVTTDDILPVHNSGGSHGMAIVYRA